ncbi:B2 metallo-beta-lactamase [Tenacibaculum sp. 190524A02b]|uniref:beta-lactamase n=1 Tax=Tenacibaculum vairaonense TaxID=3137860 RepID=A0ABM9PHW0_9FLAO
MKNIFAFLILVLFINCSTPKKQTVVYNSDKLKIEKVGNNTFIHTSYLKLKTVDKFGCNGIIYFNNNEAIVFDTAIDNEASKELINWINSQKKTIKAIVPTHFHVDCLGGLEAFHNTNIPSYAETKTILLAKEDDKEILPQHQFKKSKTFKIGQTTVLAKHYGEGHTKDNVVAYIADENTLFGGCLVKTMNAPKGFTGDANIPQWPSTIQNIKKELPNLKTVIPGHGKYGGTELLDYTIELFN